MNQGIKEQELPEKFASDDYQVLLVADKYQTGFDQPLLHTMYIDKRLSGIRAVQTLSRLNRIAPGKQDTFVLDFVNEPEEIYEAFKPYYELTDVEEEPDPHRLDELAYTLQQWQIFDSSEIDQFCEIWYRNRANPTGGEHKKLNSILDRVIERYTNLEEEEQALFKSHTISKKLGYSLSPQPSSLKLRFERGALVDRCVAPVDRNGISSAVSATCICSSLKLFPIAIPN
jgi:type I restriction enzyme R subunit